LKPAAKFLFDNDFGPSAAPKTVEPTITLAEHQALLARAKAEAHAEGIAAAAADTSRMAVTAIDASARAIESLLAQLATVEANIAAEGAGIAYTIAQKLAPALIAREPYAEVAALTKDCFRQLLSAPHVAVRVNDAVYPTAREALEEVARASGFEGRLVVLGERDIAPGDCRIEWADGGIHRDSAATQALIAKTVENYIAARRSGAALKSGLTGMQS
jgi:flagellar assembly protein FliH